MGQKDREDRPKMAFSTLASPIAQLSMRRIPAAPAKRTAGRRGVSRARSGGQALDGMLRARRCRWQVWAEVGIDWMGRSAGGYVVQMGDMSAAGGAWVGYLFPHDEESRFQLSTCVG